MKVRTLRILPVLFAYAAICFSVVGFRTANQAHADDIGFIERFALAKDRAAVLKELIPGTEDYYYFHCLHYQNTEQFDKVDSMLDKWIRRHDYQFRASQSISSRARQIVNRQMLLTYSTDSERSLAYLQRYLKLRFDHQRESLDGPSLPSVLDPVLVSRKTLTERALANYSGIQGFEASSLRWLLDEKLSRNDLYYALAQVNIPDHPKLVEMINQFISNDTHEFGNLGIHRLLTKQQLLHLANLKPRLMNNSNFVAAYLTKIRPNPDVHFESSKEAKKKHLIEMWDFAKRLSPSFNSLKAHVLYHRLLFDRSVGVYDRDRFMEYIKLPREAGYIEPKYHRQRQFNSYKVNFNQNYQSQTLYSHIGNDEPVIRSYLHHFFVADKDYKEFEPYIHYSYLKRNFAETKIVNGLGDAEEWASWISATDYQNLRNRVDLDFVHTIQQRYKSDDSVSIEMNVKNVQKLIVKVFEINTSNFYKDQNREIDTNIELDGLLPNKEYTFEYKESPFRRVLRKFDFPELSERGVYVVDFIGNRKSSRALIRKGRLRYLEQVTPAGHQLKIVDENNDLVKKASIWIQGSQYHADKSGEILVPFSTRPGRTPIIISNGDFSSFDNFNHQAESYQVQVGFHVDRESLIKGANAKVIVRPQLLINGIPASLSLLKDVRLSITSSDFDNSVSTKEVKDFKIFEDRESEYEFKVPDRLRGITFQLAGKIKNLSQGKEVSMSANETFYVNQIDTDIKVEDLFLSKINGAYYLDVLGKNGELKPGRPVRITLKHRDFKNPVNVTLQTSMNGRIKLGALKDIVTVGVAGAENTNRSWNLNRIQNTYYASVHSLAGEKIEIPLARLDTKLTHQDAALMEIRGGNFIRNQFEKLSLTDGMVTIEGLDKGDYRLYLKNVATINLKVVDGKKVAAFAVNNNRQVELKPLQPIQIKAIDRTKEKTVIQVKNANKFSRVHVIATRYVPRFDIFEQLRLSDSEPGLTTLPQSQSLYLEGRKIGDEYQYILDRKYAEKYPGIMLKRPGLLLQPWAVRTTQTTRQTPNQGTAFGGKDRSSGSNSSRGANRRGGNSNKADASNLDFLDQGSKVLLNLEINDKGQVELDNELIGDLQHLHICAISPTSSATREISFGETPLIPDDGRLVLGLDPMKRFARKKEISLVDQGKPFEITDIATGEFEIYDNLPNVYRLFTALTNNSVLSEFRFILQWSEKTDKEKLELYSKYACHELNFFLFKKDPDFFASVVKPYIANKKDKTFLDHWLLGDNLATYLDPWEFQRLNAVERILLAQSIKSEPQFTSRHIRESYEISPTTQAQFDRLFGFAVQGNALDTAGSVISGKLSEARFKYEEASRKELGQAMNGLASRQNAPAEAPFGAAGRASGGRGGAMGGGGGFGNSNGSAPSAAPKKAPSRTQIRGRDAIQADDMLNNYALRQQSGAKLKELQKNAAGKSRSFYDKTVEAKRKAVTQLFRQIDTTKEWAENNYYKLPIQQQNSNLVRVNQFWRDYSQHHSDSPFFSVNIAEASSNFTEMMFALSVMDLEWKPGEHDSKLKENGLTLTAEIPLLIYHDQIRPAKDGRKETSVLVSQNFFRVDDRYRYEGPDRLDKFVTDEFIKRTAYGCQVVVTNPTSAKQKIDLLLQIPRGAMPLKATKETRSVHLELDPYRTSSIEYFFYFPESGDYQHYPVNVARKEEVIAFAEPMKFNVVDQPSKIDKTSWAYISQFGTEAEVIDYLNANNLQRTDLNKIAWRMKEKDYFNQVISLLKQNHIFNPTLWAYAVKHDVTNNIKQFLDFNDGFVNTTGPYIETELLVNDRVARHSYEHLEYEPLVNARVHQLGKKRQILNNRFHAQYHRLLWILGCKRELSDVDRLGISYYLLLQDRISEAKSFFTPISRSNLKAVLQYDYMAAYLDMFNDEPSIARTIAAKYTNYRVNRWRNAFAEIQNQLNEIDGKGSQLVDKDNRENVQDQLAAKTPSFDFKVDAKQIEIDFQNLKQVQVNYYVMDVELLFSRNPFVQQFSGELTYIRPRKSESVKLPASGKHKWKLPPELQRSNVLVEITGAQQVKSQAYYAHAMNVQMVENYGQLKVTDAKSGRQVPKTYCKVYARLKNGKTQFYKDGYTDLRGRFDYTSLSTNDLDNVDRFSVLIMSDDLGATVREAIPPKR